MGAFVIAFFALSFLISVPKVFAVTKTAATGNWATAGTWTPNGVPAAGDAVIIPNGVTVTLSTANTNNLLSLTINSGGTLTTSSTRTITATTITVNGTYTNASRGTVTGTMTVGSTGIYNHNPGNNDVNIPTATWNPASNCNIIGIVATLNTSQPSYQQSFGNFTWNSTGQTGAISLGSRLYDIQGNFNVISTGSSTLTLTNTGTTNNLAVHGNYNQTGGSFIIATSAARTMTVDGNFSLSTGTFNLSSSTTAGNGSTLNVAGDFSHTGGTLTESGSTTASTIFFTKAGTQTYTSGGTVSNTVNFTVNSGSILQMGTAASPSTITGGGTFTLSSGATLGITSPAGITTVGTASGNIQTTTARTFNIAANYIYNGNANQATGTALPATVNNFTVNNSGAGGSNTVTLGGTIAINGNLAITAGVFATSNNAVTLNGNFTNSGTFTAGSSNIAIGGSATQSIAGFTTTGTVSMTKTGGTATLQGNVNGGALTINGSGGTFNLGSGLTHTITGAWTRTVGTLDGGSSILNIGGNVTNTAGAFTAGTSTVNYNGAGAQTTANVTYNNLILSGGGAKSIVVGTIVGANLSIAPTGSATASIASGTTISVNSLTLGGVAKASGSWGSSSSSATHKDDTYFAATTGILNVATGDSVAPTVQTVTIQSLSTINITFSEAMGTGVTTAANYTVSKSGKGTLANNPNTVTLVSGNTYLLTWSAGTMVTGADVSVTVANAQDLAGNTMGSPNFGTYIIRAIIDFGSKVKEFLAGIKSHYRFH